MSGAPANSSPPPQAAPLGRGVKIALAAIAVAALAALLWPRGESAAPGGFLLDATGRPAPLGSRLAPVTLVHFWATWCPPCIEETPAIERLASDLSGHADFALLMVAVADSTDRVKSFLGTRRADMVLYDPRWDVAHRYGSTQLPETYLVIDGRVARKFVGMTNWDDPGLRREILAHLSGGEKEGQGRVRG
jgi:thiol-disulfide isomerase/thioredoxin